MRFRCRAAGPMTVLLRVWYQSCHGELATTATLKQQRAFLADMLAQVRRGINAGKSKEKLLNEIDLSKHPVYGANTVSIQRSIRAMYDKLKK